MYLIFFFLSPTSGSHLNSLFLISSQLSLFLISTLLPALSFSHLNSALQSRSASPIILTCCWARRRHSTRMKMTGLLGGPWSSNPRPWWFRIWQVLAGAPLPSCYSDLWLLGFDRIYGFWVLIRFLLFVWLVGFGISYGWVEWVDDGGFLMMVANNGGCVVVLFDCWWWLVARCGWFWVCVGSMRGFQRGEGRK